MKGYLWLSCAGLMLVATSSRSGEVEQSLLYTTGSPPAGWTYSGLGKEYPDGCLKLDNSGDFVTTPLFDGVVTNITVVAKGGNNKGSTLAIIPSVDGAVWESASAPSMGTGYSSVTTQSFTFAVSDGYRAFKLEMRKVEGNIGVVSVSVVFVDGSAPPELPAPEALPGNNIAPEGFTANWSAVEGADGYLLDLYQIAITGSVPAAVVFSESFDGFNAGAPNGGASGTDVSASLDEYTGEAGWQGECVYQAGGTVKLGKTDARGWLMTPVCDLSSHGGLFNVGMKSCAWLNDATYFNVFIVNGEETNELGSVSELCNDSGYVFMEKSVSGSNGTTDSRIFLEASRKNNGRFFLDDLSITQGGVPGAPQTNFFCEGVALAGHSTNIADLLPGIYYYSVRAVSNELVSGRSNLITVDTEAEATPPLIEEVLPQRVRIGGILEVPIVVTPTDGDAVTSMSVAPQGEVSGDFSLTGSCFSFTPDAEDLGTQWFMVEAVDKDGVNQRAFCVHVLRPQTLAVIMDTATGVYTQDFDVLEAEGILNEWDDLAWPLSAWSACAKTAPVSTYRCGIGSATAGGVYSWGDGANRALGSLASSGNNYMYGVAFTNATELWVTRVGVSVLAQQWRVAYDQTQTLEFAYCVTNRTSPLYEGDWRRVKALCFDSPLVFTEEGQKAGPVYAAATLSATIQQPVPPGGVIILRWLDVDDAGSDHAFGIDDLVVSWVMGDTPEGIPVGWQGVGQDFDEMYNGARQALPWMWRVAVHNHQDTLCGSYPAADTCTSFANTKRDFTAAGIYNFAGALGDQAIGGLPDSAVARSITIFVKFSNATGQSLRRWGVGYQVEKYRNGTLATGAQLLASIDGESWGAVGEPTVFAADEDALGCDEPPSASVAVEQAVALPAPVAPGGTFYLAWSIGAVDSEAEGDAQALGIDEVRVAPIASKATVLKLR